MAIAARDSVTVNVGSPIDSTSAMVSEASRDASRTRPCLMCSCPSPAIPMASDHLSPAAAHSSRSSSKTGGGDVDMDSEGVDGTAGCAAAMRIAVRSASSAGSASATWRARSQLAHAATMSRVADHAPARMCQP